MLVMQECCCKTKNTLSRIHSGLFFTIVVATSVAAMKRSLGFRLYLSAQRCSRRAAHMTGQQAADTAARSSFRAAAAV